MQAVSAEPLSISAIARSRLLQLIVVAEERPSSELLAMVFPLLARHRAFYSGLPDEMVRAMRLQKQGFSNYEYFLGARQMVGQALNSDNIAAARVQQVICDDQEPRYHRYAQLFDKVEIEKIFLLSLHDSDLWSKDLFHHSEIL